MTAAEQDFARKVSAALNEAWVEVNPMLGRVAAVPRNGHGLTASMMERLAVACWKEGEPFSGIEPGLLSLLAYVAAKWNFDAGEEAEEMLALGKLRTSEGARADLALHPPPPGSVSDRAGTEHHDAATDPESGAQAGARRP